jgi:hypothetical protein
LSDRSNKFCVPLAIFSRLARMRKRPFKIGFRRSGNFSTIDLLNSS